VQPFPVVRNVLVVLFWLWLLVAVGVYAYRIFRRVAHGPKAAQASPGEVADGSTPAPGKARGRGLLAGLSTPPPPPLPDGPVEARLPRSLQDRPPPSPAAEELTGTANDPIDHDGPDGPGGPTVQAPPAPLPTLAEALTGIRMPDELLPVIDPTEAGFDEGRRAVFSGTGTNVPATAVALGDELRRLGYVVDGLDTVTSSRAGLSAHRDGTTVAASVAMDDETGAVVVRLSL
jgi:hypothetical protein